MSAILLVVMVAPSFVFLGTPKKAEAGLPVLDYVGAVLDGIGNSFAFINKTVDTTSANLALKSYAKEILRATLQNIARKALANMTASTVNWINTGFHGAPLFLQNPNSFFKDIAKFQVKDFIQVIGYDNQNYPFGKQFALDLIGSYKQQLGVNAQSSLSAVTDDPLLAEQLRIDFQTGGWGAFLLNTQYPQNNPIGFNMIAGRDLSARLDGVFQSKAERVNRALEQGQGFLSPQTCISNPAYNDGANEFNRPNFKSKMKYDPPKVEFVGNTDTVSKEYESKLSEYNKFHTSFVENEREMWAEENECPPGDLVVTTPGSVAQDFISRKLGLPQEQGVMSAALGNSMSAIFDSLLNKFLGDGLSSLASKINPRAPVDDFTYYGQTLGSPADSGSNTNWSLGPDEEIDLATFQRQLGGGSMQVTDSNGEISLQYTPGAIELTEQELKLIFNDGKMSNGTTNSNNFGIIQILDLTWPKIKELDMCIPGPDKDWEKRLDEERERILNGKLNTEIASDDNLKAKAANSAMRDLRFAVSAFKDWVTSKMIASLPNAIIYMDEVENLDGKYQQISELNSKKTEKTTVLARLKAIKIALDAITVQPTPGSAEEKNLITIRKQFNVISYMIGSTSSRDELRSQLDLTKAKLQDLFKLNNECMTERRQAGWVEPLGYIDYKESRLPNKAGTVYIFGREFNKFIIPYSYTTNGTELEQFCVVPANSGYSHGDVIRKDTSNNGGALKFTFRNMVNDNGYFGFEDLPMLNAHNVYGDDTKKLDPIDVAIDCNTIFKTNDQNYKQAGNLGY